MYLIPTHITVKKNKQEETKEQSGDNASRHLANVLYTHHFFSVGYKQSHKHCSVCIIIFSYKATPLCMQNQSTALLLLAWAFLLLSATSAESNSFLKAISVKLGPQYYI